MGLYSPIESLSKDERLAMLEEMFYLGYTRGFVQFVSTLLTANPDDRIAAPHGLTILNTFRSNRDAALNNSKFIQVTREVMTEPKRKESMGHSIGMSTFSSISTTGLFVVDVHGIVEAWDEGAEAIFKKSAKDAVGQRLDDVLPLASDSKRGRLPDFGCRVYGDKKGEGPFRDHEHVWVGSTVSDAQGRKFIVVAK